MRHGPGRAFEYGQGLSGESFVDLNQVSIGRTQTSFCLGFRYRVNGTEPHSRRIAAGISITGQKAERTVAEALGFFFRHDQKGDCAVRDLRGITSRYSAGSAVKDGPEFGESFSGLIFARAIVFGDNGRFGGQKRG